MEPDPLEAVKARLVAVCADLDAARSDSSGLLEERRVLVVELRAAGVQRTEIAELAGCSLDSVKAILKPQIESSAHRRSAVS